MIAKDFLVSFLEYNFSADERVLDQVEQLTPEQLHAESKISHKTAYALVRHMLDTEWSYRLYVRGEPGQKYLWEVEDIPDLPAIRRFWTAERDRMLDYVRSLSKVDLEQAIEFGAVHDEGSESSTVWQILLHVVNHSTHHRSELSRYLEDCGYPVAEKHLDFHSFIMKRASRS